MNNLLRLIGRRLIALPIMAIGVTMLVFFVMELSPIDPAWTALGDNAADPAQVKAFNIAHGYVTDDGSETGKPIPAVVRYFNYLVGLCQGDFGIYGVGTGHKVVDLIAPCASGNPTAHFLWANHCGTDFLPLRGNRGALS